MKITKTTIMTSLKYLFLIQVVLLTSACSTAPTKNTHNDLMEPANRVIFKINETLDQHIVKPVAIKYVEAVPTPVRTSVTNFFDNLTYLNVILNHFLQGKVALGTQETLRFIYNSTFGIGGLFDVATKIDMPKNNEDFGQTLAVWGVGSGTYLYVPFIGPSTVRDSTGNALSRLLNPFFYLSSPAMIPIEILGIINKRANLLQASSIRDDAAIDPYVFTREAYTQRREFLIYDGNPPLPDDDFEDIFDSMEEDEDPTRLIIE